MVIKESSIRVVSTWSWWSWGRGPSGAPRSTSRAAGGRSRPGPRSRRRGGRTRPPSLLFRRCFFLFLLLLLPLLVHGLTVLLFRRFHCFTTLFAAIICTLLFRSIYFASLLLLFRCRLLFLCRFFCRFRTVFRFFFLLFRLFLLYLLCLLIVFGGFLSLFIINFSISPCL